MVARIWELRPPPPTHTHTNWHKISGEELQTLPQAHPPFSRDCFSWTSWLSSLCFKEELLRLIFDISSMVMLGR
ncbi:hypothetical protein MLD38_040800 [Melastoma candidum]|nr:hypothetical protein MLD38_040800 [Melastoma candidum]